MSPRTMPPTSVLINMCVCVVCFVGEEAIKSLQGIIVLGKIGVFLLGSCVTGHVAAPRTLNDGRRAVIAALSPVSSEAHASTEGDKRQVSRVSQVRRRRGRDKGRRGGCRAAAMKAG